MSVWRSAARDCGVISSGLQNSALLLEQPLKQRRSLRKSRKGRPQNGNGVGFCGNVQPVGAEQLCTEEQLQKISDTPGEGSTAQPQEHAHQATRKVSRRKAEVEEHQSEDASGSKRVCLEQLSHTTSPTTPQPENPNWEPSAREAVEVIDVETLSPSGAEGSQGGRPEWKENGLREAEEELELEHSSCDEIIVVDGDGEDEDVLRGSSLVTHQLSVPWPESSKHQSEEEEEEIDVVGEQSLRPSAAVWATGS